MKTRSLLPRPEVPLVPVAPFERERALLAERGLDTDALLARAGIDRALFEDSEGMMTLDQLESWVLVTSSLPDQTDWALDLGNQLHFPTYGQLGFALLTAPNMASGFAVAETYLELIAPIFSLRRRYVGESLEVSFSPVYQLSPPVLSFLTRFFAASLVTLSRAALGEVPPGVVLELEAVHDTELLAWLQSHNVRVRRGETFITLWIPLSVAESPLLLANEEMHADFVAGCARELSELQRPDSTIVAVRRALRDAGPPFPNRDAISVQLSLGVDELRERLSAEGASFRQLQYEAKLLWARNELVGSDSAVTTIAYELGYSDSANFTRSFRRSFGVSPSEYRRRYQGDRG